MHHPTDRIAPELLVLYSGQMHMASEIQTRVNKYLQNHKFNLQSGQQILKSIALGQVKFKFFLEADTP